MRSRNRAGKTVHQINNRITDGRWKWFEPRMKRLRRAFDKPIKAPVLTRQEKDLEMFKINLSKHPDRKHWLNIKDNVSGNGEYRFWYWAAASGCKR